MKPIYNYCAGGYYVRLPAIPSDTWGECTFSKWIPYSDWANKPDGRGGFLTQEQNTYHIGDNYHGWSLEQLSLIAQGITQFVDLCNSAEVLHSKEVEMYRKMYGDPSGTSPHIIRASYRIMNHMEQK